MLDIDQKPPEGTIEDVEVLDKALTPEDVQKVEVRRRRPKAPLAGAFFYSVFNSQPHNMFIKTLF